MRWFIPTRRKDCLKIFPKYTNGHQSVAKDGHMVDPDSRSFGAFVGTVVAWIVIGLFALIFFIWPKYNVYRRGLSGQAQLREAEYNRQIAVLEAKAKSESAEMHADAEIKKAKGVAEANKIIGTSLKDNEGYLRWRW